MYVSGKELRAPHRKESQALTDEIASKGNRTALASRKDLMRIVTEAVQESTDIGHIIFYLIYYHIKTFAKKTYLKHHAKI
jgi:hypothetical protein